jgi:hypothetical protein
LNFIHLKQAAPHENGRSAKIMPIDADFLSSKLHERYCIQLPSDMLSSIATLLTDSSVD